MVTGIHLHALFVCLKHCLSEEATTKELCLFPQTVPVTLCLFKQKHYLNRLSLSQERKDYVECVQFDVVFCWYMTKLNLLTPVNTEIIFFYTYCIYTYYLVYICIYSLLLNHITT